MKKLFLPIATLIIICITTNASHGAEYWAKSYRLSNNECRHSASFIQQTTDGGYIVAGNAWIYVIGGYEYFWILKLDNCGNTSWLKTYEGSNNDIATCIQQTTDGGYIVAGSTDSFGAGSEDIWVLKLDSNGSVIWQKTYGGGDYDIATCIQQTTDGGYIVAGATDSFGAGDQDLLVLKLNDIGEVIWQRTFGGSSDEIARSIQQTTDGGYIVAGNTNSFGSGVNDIWVVKLDANGNISWEQTYGGILEDRAFSIQPTADGGYVLAGDTFSFGAGSDDIWVLKLNGSGEIVWQKTFGGGDDDLALCSHSTSGKAGGLKNVNRSKRLRNH